jgi:AraC-like DNA-binding protein
MLHAMGYAWIASRTLSEALERFIRYHRMLSTNIAMSLERAQGVTQLVASMIDTIPEATESVIVFSLQLCRQSFGDDLVPMQVKLTRQPPQDSSPIDAFFRCQVDYNCSENVIVYNSADLNRRLDGANPAVVIAMEGVINTYVERFDANDVVSRVRQVVAAALANGEPAKQDIAEQLGMAPRTLQRRLEEQQSSVKAIVDETRHQLSIEFLDQGHYTIKEIAYNLGFSDASNFSRAFKRWEDKSPRDYRIRGS